MSTISVNIVSDSQQFERSMRRAERSANEFSKKTTKSFQNVAVGGVSLGKLATVGGLAIFTKKVGEAAAALVNMASDAAEAEAAFTTTFGPAVDDVNKFVDEMANKMGSTRSEMQQLLAVTGAVTQGIGMTAEESANFSVEMAKVAGDLASFMNLAGGSEEALRALQSAVNGERESLKRLGAAITETEVQQKAMNDTGKTSVKELTRQEKAMATLALVQEKTKIQMGDLERTQDSFANTSRRMAAEVRQAGEDMGKVLLPVAEDLAPVIAEVMTPALEKATDILRSLVGMFNETVNAMDAFADGVTDFELRIAKGESRTEAFIGALHEMEEEGRANADTILQLGRHLGFTDEEIRKLTNDASQSSTALADASRQTDVLTEASQKALLAEGGLGIAMALAAAKANEQEISNNSLKQSVRDVNRQLELENDILRETERNLAFTKEATDELNFANIDFGNIGFKVDMAISHYNDTLIENTEAYLDSLDAAEEARIENEKLAQSFQDNMLPSLSSVLSAFESLEDVQNRGASAQRRLNDATAALERQNEKVAKSANKVSAAQKKVNDLKGDGTDIDAREALSLKRQMEKIADLTKKQEEGEDVLLELEVAQLDYNEALQKAQEPSKAYEEALRNLEQAEKDLASEQERQQELIQKQIQAKDDFAKATEESAESLLEEALAVQKLEDTLNQFSTEGFESALEKIAELTGKTMDEVKTEFAEAGITGDKFTGSGVGAGDAMPKVNAVAAISSGTGPVSTNKGSGNQEVVITAPIQTEVVIAENKIIDVVQNAIVKGNLRGNRGLTIE